MAYDASDIVPNGQVRFSEAVVNQYWVFLTLALLPINQITHVDNPHGKLMGIGRFAYRYDAPFSACEIRHRTG